MSIADKLGAKLLRNGHYNALQGHLLIAIAEIVSQQLAAGMDNRQRWAFEPAYFCMILNKLKQCLSYLRGGQAVLYDMPKKQIISFIDFFYPPFRKVLPVQTFRYAACGGFNTFLDIFIYFIAYNYILHKQVLNIGILAFKPHIAAFIISFCVSFPTGFLLMRHVVFTGSILHGRVQLFRYFVLVVICIVLNYVFIKLFVERFHIYPTIAKMITTAIVVSFSYITQKRYTFKAPDKPTPSLQPTGPEE